MRVLASAADDGPAEARGFALVRPFPVRALDGLAFWSSLPFRVASQLRSWRPDAVVAQSPYDGAAALVGRVLSRSDAKVLVEVHGDWRTATRLYGSRRRRLLAPLGDRIALEVTAPRRRSPCGLGLHGAARGGGGASAGRRLPGVHGSRAVRARSPRRSRNGRRRCSSASSSSTRTSTGSLTPGGSRRLACRRPGSRTSAPARAKLWSRSSSPTFRTGRGGSPAPRGGGGRAEVLDESTLLALPR